MEKPSLGEIISTNRKKKNLTQKALADQLNVTDKAVSKWERNVALPDINTIPKLAEILEVPAEELINIPISSKQPADTVENPPEIATTNIEQDDELNRIVYKERARQLLIKGLLGFAAGFLFALITTLDNKDNFSFGFAALIGIFTAGVPYGWELLGNIIGRWYVVGHIGAALMVAGLKLFISLLIGWIIYPIALLYNVIKAQRKGSKLKIVLIILLIIFLAWTIFFFSVICFNVRDEDPSEPVSTYEDVAYNDSDSYATVEEIQYVTDVKLLDDPEILNTISEKALNYSLLQEEHYANDGHEIVIPVSLKAAYFLTETDSENRYYDFGTGTFVNNAILVLGHYNVNIANTSPRDKWVICVFPNFVMNEDGVPSYDAANEYCEYLQASSLENVYEWMCKEYEGMNITPIDIPLS